MASSKKSSSSRSKTSAKKAEDAKIEDAVVVETESADTPEKTAPDATTAVDVAVDDDAASDSPKSADETSDAKPASEDVSNAQSVADDTPVDELADTSAANTVPPEGDGDAPQTKADASDAPTAEAVHPVPVPAQVAPRSNTFLPLVLGGIIAGIIGFMAAELDIFGRNDTTEIAGLRNTVGDQQARIATLEEAPPAEAVDLAPLQDQLSAAEERIAALEARPTAPAEGNGAAAYSEELSSLKSSIETQRAEIQTLLDNAKSVEEATADAARAANAQTAITQIVSAIDAGQPYQQPLNALQSLDVGTIDPVLTQHATEGVVTLNMLQAQFPDAARSALSSARASGAVEGEQGFSSFLKRQLGARSVTPREGNDPDAILSRAEAALLSGDLTETLTELDALPEQAQSALADWRAAADARVSARAAADDLAQRLTAD